MRTHIAHVDFAFLRDERRKERKKAERKKERKEEREEKKGKEEKRKGGAKKKVLVPIARSGSMFDIKRTTHSQLTHTLVN
jgi:sRNA-binding protein